MFNWADVVLEYTVTDNSIENGNPFIHSNIQGTFNLIEVARKNKNLKKFIRKIILKLPLQLYFLLLKNSFF